VILLSSILYIFSFQSETEPSSYALSKIELTQMLGSNIFRDESQDVTQLDQQINRSLSLALAGNSEQATDILSRLMSESLTDIQKIRIRFNLGILAYNDGEFDRSLDLFTEINELGVPGTADYIYENTQWYVANIHLKQGNFDRSEKLLSQLASGSGIHATKAEELLSSISD
jgi:lipopolysaccharide biosynthesis regulator YciM